MKDKLTEAMLWLAPEMIAVAVGACIMCAAYACHPPPPAPVYVDSGDAAALLNPGPYATPCQRACANLVALGCSDGRSSCVAACEGSYARHTISDLTLNCLAMATTCDVVCP